MDRRKFITRTTKQLALVNLLGFSASKAAFGNTFEKSNLKDIEQNEIIYRTLGRTGINVPIVSMGVMNATIPGLITRSYEKGVRLFDTAWFYQNGMNEKMVGDVVKSQGIRNDIVLMTKIYLKETERNLYQPEIKKLFLERFEESLRRLKTDYVDVLFHHAVHDIKEQNNPYIIEAMQELKDAGKIRHAAVSFHGDDAALLDDVVKKKFYDVVMIMFNIALADDARLAKSIENAANEGVGIVAMKTQCGGGGGMWWERNADSRETIGELNHKAMLKWVLNHEFVATAIPGYTTFDQLDENFSITRNLEYSPEEIEFLDKAQVKLASNFCAHCERCVGSCPKKVDIPALMHTYMYAYAYRNMEHAIATEKTIPKHRGLKNCYACDSCQVTCPRSVQVTKRINALKELNFNYS